MVSAEKLYESRLDLTHRHSAEEVPNAFIDRLIWIPLTLVELVTFLFTLKKSIAVYKLVFGSRLRAPPLIAQLLRDNILYFLVYAFQPSFHLIYA